MKINKIPTLAALMLFCTPSLLQAQHSISLDLGFSQTKEEQNEYMVFGGPALSINYGYMDISDEKALSYGFRLGVDLLFNRGILGINAHIAPADFFYGFRVDASDDFDLYVGPRVSWEYNVGIYPDLMQGHAMWFTNINLSPAAIAEKELGGGLVRTQLSFSLVGLTSRPPAERDEYYWSIAIGDVFSDIHSDMNFGSYDKFMHLTFSAEYLFGETRTWGLGYNFDYYNYFDVPEAQALNHSLNVKYNFGGGN